MSGLLGELVEVLSSQLLLFEELLLLSEEKKNIIIANDVETLKKMTIVENSNLSKLNRLENKRMELMEDMAVVLNLSDKDVTIKSLADAIKDEDNKALLMGLGTKISSVLNRLNEVNLENERLIQNSLEYIHFSVNIMRNSGIAENATSSYIKNGKSIKYNNE